MHKKKMKVILFNISLYLVMNFHNLTQHTA